MEEFRERSLEGEINRLIQELVKSTISDCISLKKERQDFKGLLIQGTTRIEKFFEYFDKQYSLEKEKFDIIKDTDYSLGREDIRFSRNGKENYYVVDLDQYFNILSPKS